MYRKVDKETLTQFNSETDNVEEEGLHILQIEQPLHIPVPIPTAPKVLTEHQLLEGEFQPLSKWLQSLDSKLEEIFWD